MKQSVFGKPIADESHSRNAFDRSEIKHINFSGGMLIPTFCKFVFGHSHVRINQSSHVRTAQPVRPSFPQLPVYTDYFYVPMHQILTNWNAFRSRTQDRASSALGIPLRLPVFSDAAMTALLNAQHSMLSPYLDEVDNPDYWNTLRLLDLFNYGNNKSTVYYDTQNNTVVKNAVGDQNLLKLCAYQKVFYDHYRNTAYQSNNVNAYNLDKYFGSMGPNEGVNPSTLAYTDIAPFFALHYANYKKDYFNTIYPSLNFNAMGMSFNLQALNVLPSSVINTYTQSGVDFNELSPKFSSLSVDVNYGNNTNNSTVSTNNIRAAFALEKLLRVAAFTPQHVKDQFKARFGYVPGSESKHESVRLGSFKNVVVVGEVTSTADTGILGLGAVGGKGIGHADFENPISYDVPEDGIIIGITYVLPTQSYDSNFVDPINQQFVAEDWSLPEYENLGLQPIYNKNVAVERNSGGDTDAAQIARGNQILGYQPRDMQFKASVNQNHGQFTLNEQLAPYVLHGRVDWRKHIGQVGQTGLTAQYFKCAPADFMSLFYAGGGNQEDFDQFFGEFVVAFACIQDKPIFGIPKL